jgi:hypothetical protein
MAYSQEDKDIIIKEILNLIRDGKSLRSAILELNKCNRDTFNEWMKIDSQLSDQYVQACEERADSIFEEIIEIADNTTNDSIITDKGEIPNNEWIARSRLRVDARKWAVSKMNPKKYGDKTDVTTNGRDINTIITAEKIKEISNTLDDEV